jgi:hypothetical protein
MVQVPHDLQRILETANAKTNEFLAKVPMVDGHVTKLSKMTNLEKPYVVYGAVAAMIVFLFLLRSGDFAV